MQKIKKIDSYILSVEGQTEQWYFEHLQKMINDCKTAKRRVSFTTKIMSPKRTIRSFQNISGERTFFHICDYESNEDGHRISFTNQ